MHTIPVFQLYYNKSKHSIPQRGGAKRLVRVRDKNGVNQVKPGRRCSSYLSK